MEQSFDWGSLVSAGASLYGGKLSSDAQERMFQKNLDQQRDFAQQGIRWRVADAKEAGIHPLAAMGAQTTSFAPVTVGDTSMGSAISQAGQDISRGITAKWTNAERVNKKIQELSVERGELENMWLRSKIARENANPTPSMPSALDAPIIDGQGNSLNKTMDIVKPRRTASALGTPDREAGAVSDWGYARTPTGLAIVPSDDVKQKIEDQIIPELAWAYRNMFVPAVSGGASHRRPSVKEFKLPKGYTEWQWNPIAQEYQPGHFGYDDLVPWSKNKSGYRR